MTETQATSGAAGTSTNPVDTEHADGTAAGRAAVGRATVPASESPDNTGAAPKYTRAPGMVPPPDAPGESSNRSDGPATRPQNPASAAPPGPGGGSMPATTAVPPVVTASGTFPVVAAPMAMGVFAPASVSGPPVSGPPVSAPPAYAPPVSAPPGGPGSPAPPGRPGARGGATGRVAIGPPTTRGVPGMATGAVGAARVSDALRTTRSTGGGGAASRGPRRARLNVKRIDPWSVMKFSCAVSVVLFIVVIVATSVLYLALDAMGVFDSVNSTLSDMVGATGGADGGGSGFKITARGVIGTAALLGAVNVVLLTALATLAAFVYNVCADLVGGIELTLSERD